MYAGSLGPIGFGGMITERLRRLGQAIVDSFQLQGLFNADVVIDSSNQIWLLEINPRWSGSTELIERSLGDGSNDGRGISLLGTVLDATPLSRLPIKPNASGPVYWKRILYARDTKRFCFDDVRGELGRYDRGCLITIGPQRARSRAAGAGTDFARLTPGRKTIAHFRRAFPRCWAQVLGPGVGARCWRRRATGANSRTSGGVRHEASRPCRLALERLLGCA